MKKITCLILLLSTFSAFAQKEASNWYFGIFSGIHFEDDGNVSLLSGSQIQTNEGCSSISDAAGNMLFYTDGRNVWDRNHILMPNGNYSTGTGLLGDPSSTQSAIIIPKKGDPDIYYIFTVDEPHHENAAVYPNQFTGTYADGGTTPGEDDGFNNGFNYSVVDLSITGENGSIGDIIIRNTHLLTYDPDNSSEARYKCSEKVTALKNNDGTGYWVVTHFLNKFYAFQVTAEGVNETPVVTQVNPLVPASGYRRNAIGCIKASPNGKKIVIAHVQLSTITGSTESNGAAWLYDFNDATGVVSNPLAISQDVMPYGVEFSQKSQKLYVSYDNGNGFGGLHQYDLLSSDIPASDVFISGTNQSGTLQLGPNGKIYRAVVNTPQLDVINNPEEDGELCNFSAGQVALGSGLSFFGLPPFITSYFAVSIISTNKCFSDQTLFELDVDGEFDTVAWDFGDSATSPASTVNTTAHTYAATGTYTVVATVVYQGETRTVSSDITITATPVANTPETLRECDPDNDGITVFDLLQNTLLIVGEQDISESTVKYFTSKEAADSNINAIANPGSYTNDSNPQRIFARIHNNINTECYNTTSFLIETIDSPPTQPVVEDIICLNNPDGLTLTAITSNADAYEYLWSTRQTSSKITIHKPGVYSVIITNLAGCSNEKKYIITASDTAIITDVIVNDLRENNTVTIIASPPSGVETVYLYSLDSPNGPYVESNFFENVSSGVHTVYIMDTKGCGIISQEITVLATPRFFTPNGDGINDTWNIIGINSFFYPKSKIYIFDRYGRLLADVDPKGLGWDGYTDGRQLPATDYWYVVELDNGRTIKGHFSLIR